MAFPSMDIGNLHLRLPIIQGGMGVGISLSGLAAAVAQAGGLGVIATAGIGHQESTFATDYINTNNEVLRREIRRARELTDGPIGVNIMVALTNYVDLVKTAIQEKIDAIISGAGLPLDLPALAESSPETKLIPIVSSARAAVILCKKWFAKFRRMPDAFVVEGPMAGGHLGFKREQINDPDHRLEKLVPEVIAGVRPFAEQCGRPIPVIAAGGVYTGADICKYLEMGAAGVQMGTRFVATHECDASQAFKETYVTAKEEDIVIIQSPVGLPGRAVRNDFLVASEKGGRKPPVCPFHCIHTCDYTKAPYCITLALVNAKMGRLKSGFAFAGQNAYRVDRIMSVQELVDSLEKEYDAVVPPCLSAAGKA